MHCAAYTRNRCQSMFKQGTCRDEENAKIFELFYCKYWYPGAGAAAKKRSADSVNLLHGTGPSPKELFVIRPGKRGNQRAQLSSCANELVFFSPFAGPSSPMAKTKQQPKLDFHRRGIKGMYGEVVGQDNKANNECQLYGVRCRECQHYRNSESLLTHIA